MYDVIAPTAPLPLLPENDALCADQILRCALGHDTPAGVAAFGAEIDDPVGIGDTSRLCSMTTTVLPASTSRCSTRISFSTSAICRPTVGSSST